MWRFTNAFLLLCSILEQTGKRFSCIFFFNCCSRGMWTVPEMLHWRVLKKLGYRLYYFVRVGVTYHAYCRKIVGKDIKSHWAFVVQFKSRSDVQVRFCMKRDRVKSLHSLWSMIWIYINLYFTVYIRVGVDFFRNYCKKSRFSDFYP